MSLELVMNASGAIDHGSGSPVSGGAFVITSTPSAEVKAEGGGVYRGPLTYTFSGGDATGFDSGTVATLVPQTIAPTAAKVKANSLLVIRLGDSGTMAASGTVTATGSPGPVGGPVEVADAGQSTTKAQ